MIRIQNDKLFMKVIVIRKYGQLVSGDEATRVNCQHWLDNKQVFCFDVFIIGPELRRNPPWWYLACTTECSALMLLLWEVWSNLACCVHCPLLLSPGSLWWWPHLTCPPHSSRPSPRTPPSLTGRCWRRLWCGGSRSSPAHTAPWPSCPALTALTARPAMLPWRHTPGRAITAL